MQDHEGLTAAQQELAAALVSLKASVPGIDRNEVMYRAGLAAGRRGCRRLAVAAMVLGVVLGGAVAAVTVYRPQATERIVRVPQTTVEAHQARRVEPWPVPVTPLGADAGQYLRLRREVLARGLAALPEESFGGGSGETYEEYRELLSRPATQPPPGGPLKLWRLFHRGDES